MARPQSRTVLIERRRLPRGREALSVAVGFRHGYSAATHLGDRSFDDCPTWYLKRLAAGVIACVNEIDRDADGGGTGSDSGVGRKEGSLRRGHFVDIGWLGWSLRWATCCDFHKIVVRCD
jgi:hypothetical protein